MAFFVMIVFRRCRVFAVFVAPLVIKFERHVVDFTDPITHRFFFEELI